MERRFRLRRPGDVRRVYQVGRSWSHSLLTVVAHPNHVSFTRIGVAASRRIGKAVARNRAKRLLREAARRLYPQITPGWDLMLIARPAILQAKEPQVETALTTLLETANLDVSIAPT